MSGWRLKETVNGGAGSSEGGDELKAMITQQSPASLPWFSPGHSGHQRAQLTQANGHPLPL